MTAGPNSNKRQRHASSRSRQKTTPVIASLASVLAELRIQKWDLLLVGDGSGTGWQDACGWATVVIERHSGGRCLRYGGMDAGTVNIAEVMPYVQALSWYHADKGGDGRNKLKARGTLNVHVITDSQLTANTGNAIAAGGNLPAVGVGFWAAIREFQRVGYHCTWHWAARSTTLLNWCSDLIASMSRKAMLRAGDWKLHPAEVDAMRLVLHDGLQHIYHSGRPPEAPIIKLVETLQRLLEPGDSAAHSAACELDGVRLRDPAGGEISLHDLNHDHDPPPA